MYRNYYYICLAGVSGVILTLLVFIIYTFALQYARRHVFKAFWFTHNLYILLFIFLVLHGIGRLVQPPYFQFFFIGPVFLFIGDRLISISRKKEEIAVLKADLLPSGRCGDVANCHQVELLQIQCIVIS